ncbi:hypothetical protein ID866_4203 [Astraeus odoratus]|nr:hypothetical protein ID866_4203 [Astraeus odoratus]
MQSISQAPKKDKKEENEDDKAFKDKKKAEEAALKAAREKGKFTSVVIQRACTDYPMRVYILVTIEHTHTRMQTATKGGPPPSGGIKNNSESENYTDIEPFIRTNLTQGAFFTILPPLGSPEREVHVPEWNIGNVYALSRAPAQLVKLPVSPSRSGNGTRYEVVVCGAYEIRLFGDPGAYGSPYPILDITFSVELAFPVFLSSGSFGASSDNSEDTVIPPLFSPLQLAPAHSVAPHIVGGRPFGDAIGIGLTSIDFGEQGWWTVTDARLVCSQVAVSSLAVTLLEPIRIAPTQTRVVPLCIILSESDTIPESITQLVVELVCSAPVSASTVRSNQFILEAAVPLVHVPQWTQSSSNTILATYFFARSMPTAFTVIPPHLPFVEMHFPRGDGEIGWTCRGNEPVLALHGAGVDIVTHPFFADSLLRQKYAWVILPQGRTEWGLDWHGPSTDDAFSAVLALSRILSALGSPGWTSWSFDPNTRVVLMGHSNGGQGAWYIAERYPDRVCGVVPASGYIKSQAYVPWGMSRFAHFIDPFLRAVLETSLTPDDNDVFMSNLAGIPILALQGGADDNVPPWHTRELVGVLKTCVPDADVRSVSFTFRLTFIMTTTHWVATMKISAALTGIQKF